MKRQYPGEELKDSRDIASRIVSSLRGARGRDRRRRVAPGAGAEMLVEAWYFLLYKHPVHDFKDRLFRVAVADVRAFIQAEFNPERMEGADVIITNEHMTFFVIGNHDGDLYVVDGGTA